jgi:hypothetical protein
MIEGLKVSRLSKIKFLELKDFEASKYQDFRSLKLQGF